MYNLGSISQQQIQIFAQDHSLTSSFLFHLIPLFYFIVIMPIVTLVSLSIYTIIETRLCDSLSSMKLNKIYNLALSSHPVLPDTPHLTNIFTEETRKLHARELNPSKQYQLVGQKELQSYQKRIKKNSRLTIKADSLSTDRPISKASTDKKAAEELLSKEEVMERVGKVALRQMTHPDEPRKVTKHRRESWITFSTDFDHNATPIIVAPKLQASKFSLTRLKKQMRGHKKQWSSHPLHEDSKFPNIYKSIEMHRLKLQRREEQAKADEQLVITRSNLWGETLRNQKRMVDIFRRDLSKTFHNQNAFHTRGHSKISMEKQWLQRKDEAGFKFKLCCPSATLDIKETLAIR